MPVKGGRNSAHVYNAGESVSESEKGVKLEFIRMELHRMSCTQMRKYLRGRGCLYLLINTFYTVAKHGKTFRKTILY